MMRSLLLKCSALLAVLVLQGCAAANVQMFSGEPRASSEVATLLNSRKTGLLVYEVDDKNIQSRIATYDPDAWEQVQLLPGEHTLTGGLYQGSRYAIFVERYSFAAGKRYQMAYEIVNDKKVRFSLVEVP